MSPKFLLSLFLALLPYFCYAQQNALGLSYGLGYTVPNHPRFPELKGPSHFGELEWTFKANRPWSLLNGGSRLHLSASVQNFGNSAVLGTAFAVTPHMSFFIFRKKAFSAQIQLGWGAAWLTKKFDSFYNPANIAIGTHLNASVSARFELAYRLKNFEPYFRLSVQHYSNGNAMSPNLGFNVPMLQSGLRFLFKQEIREHSNFEMPEFKRQFRPFIQVGIGLTATVHRGPFYPVYNVNSGVQWLYKPVRSLWAGLEYSYNSSVHQFYLHNGTAANHNFNRYAFWLGHEWIFGRVGFFALGGFYLNRHANQRSLFPTQTGLNFYPKLPYTNPKNQFWIGVHIRAYFGLADYVMLQLGYRF